MKKFQAQEGKKKEEIRIDLHPSKPLALLSLLDKFDHPEKVVSIKVNNKALNLNKTLSRFGKNVKICPVYSTSLDGNSMLRRSFVFVLGKAMAELQEKAGEKPRSFLVRHQVRNGYFCEFADKVPPEEEFLQTVSEKIRSYIKQEIPITQKQLYHVDALEYLKEQNQEYSVKLLESQNAYDVTMDICGNYKNLHHRVLVYNTKTLGDFRLKKKEHGFVLIFMNQQGIDTKYTDHDRLEDSRVIRILKEQTKFNHTCGVGCVGDINEIIQSKTMENDTTPIEYFIDQCNAYHDRLMNTMVRKIVKHEKKNVRLILIAGPSSSGKTTFAKKLKILLHCSPTLSEVGAKTHMISVDNYFRPNEECPINPKTGTYDFECLEALRIDLLNDHLIKLFNGEKVMMPEFDFHRGFPIDNKIPLQIGPKDILIMEGIHCLNEKLTAKVSENIKYKIFIAPFSPISFDDRNYISNSTFRLLRRIVRDWLRRGHSVENTLFMWPNVRRSEHKYIFPYIGSGDFIFNTAFDYEIGVLKNYIKPLLKTVRPDSPYFSEAQDKLLFVEKFISIPYKYVKRDSILQEFIGGHHYN